MLNLGLIFVLGTMTSIFLNIFLQNKYTHYELTNNHLVLSGLLSVIFSIVISFKLSNYDYFCNLSEYIRVLFLVVSGVMSGTLSSSFIIDILFRELPDENNIIIGLSILVISAGTLGYKVIFSSIIMFIIFIILSLLTGQFGMGDVKMMFFMGLGMLPERIIHFLFTSFLIAFIYSIYIILFKKSRYDNTIPFGPFLIIGFLKTIL